MSQWMKYILWSVALFVVIRVFFLSSHDDKKDNVIVFDGSATPQTEKLPSHLNFYNVTTTHSKAASNTVSRISSTQSVSPPRLVPKEARNKTKPFKIKKRSHKPMISAYSDEENIMKKVEITFGEFADLPMQLPRTKSLIKTGVLKSLQVCRPSNNSLETSQQKTCNDVWFDILILLLIDIVFL